MKQLVTDIDNTILRTERRLRKVLEELGWEGLFSQIQARYDGVKALLKPEEQELFYRLFLSERYLWLDEPLPGAAEALQALREAGYRIVYLTGRHDAPGDSMRAGTEAWLEEHGFPHPGDGSTLLWMKPKRGLDDRDFKGEALKEILKLGPVRAGIGDRESDIEAYLNYGIPAILVRGDHYSRGAPREGPCSIEAGVKVVRDWWELKALLLG
ncbi:MAG: HAD family hydrolase [Candidatus Bipolaricaulia bacterium]